MDLPPLSHHAHGLKSRVPATTMRGMGRTEAWRKLYFLLVAVLWAGCIVQRASAQEQPTVPATGESLRVFLATMEPGDAPWERFGHNCIIILDERAGRSWAYNFGVFDFDAPNFIGNFVRGKMTYWMEAAPGGPTLDMYVQAKRSVWLDELNLTPEQRVKLFERLEWNRLPENKHYQYDYFRDNCATRVRDALDWAIDGQLREQLTRIPTESTYRWHARIGMAAIPPLYAGVQLGMGPATDVKLSAWEECFVPAKFMEHARRLKIRQDEEQVPFVRDPGQIYQSTREALPSQPPAWWWIFLLIGMAIGGAVAFFGQTAHRNTWRRVVFLWIVILWSLVCTLASIFLLSLWFLTNHEAGWRNESLLQFSPLSLVVLLAAVRGFRWRWSASLVLIVLGIAVLGVVLKPLPWFDQWNWEMIALALPAHIGVAMGVWMLQNKKQVIADENR